MLTWIEPRGLAISLCVLGLPLGTGLSLAMDAFGSRGSGHWRDRPLAAWLVHAGSWGLCYVLAVALLQRGALALATTLTLQWVVQRSHQAKCQSLKEPFLLQDFEYFLDAIRHPRLYLPFFGIGLALGASLAALVAVSVFIILEPWLLDHLSLSSMAQLLSGLAVGPALALVLGLRQLPAATLVPCRDHDQLGLWSCFWAYARFPRSPIDTTQAPALLRQPPSPVAQDSLPHLVIVQGESFFDPRPWYNRIPRNVLTHWDRLSEQSITHGFLKVPAWGANTIRSETAFLCGLNEDALGMHRFNPYRQLARQPVPSLASACARMGYRTLVLHPYPGGFYQRDKVMPRLGFQAFEDIESFRHCRRDGPFIADAELARRVAQALDDPDPRPLMVFVITMESHGPFLLEPAPDPLRWLTADASRPEDVTHELDIYLHHLANTDAMLGTLSETLARQSRPGLLCAYGDHVPILSPSYRWHGEPEGTTPFMLWSNRPGTTPLRESPSDLSQLAEALLDAADWQATTFATGSLGHSLYRHCKEPL
tara:strand:- start:2804 stop:4417 length:1614 start_codon:yes stop_codon:yes gene_type:complete